MSYYNDKKQVKKTNKNETVAVANSEFDAEIIVKALNLYFGDWYTRNEVVGMMNSNTASSLKSISDAVKIWQYDAKEITDYLIEISEVMEAQALVVSMRDELNFGKPNDDDL